MKLRKSNRRNHGFTLLELMVAMGITAVIVTVLVTVTGIATDTWTRSRSEIRASRQAKTMLDLLAKDFESFVSRRGNDSEWLYAAIDSSADLPNVVRNQGGSTEAPELIFFSAVTDRYLGQLGTETDKGGDVSCVAYASRFQDPVDPRGTAKTSSFVLYRLLVNPDETFKNLLGEEDLKTAFNSYSNELTDRENFVCENVIQFTLTFLVEVTRSGGAGSASTVETARVTLGSGNSSAKFRLSGTGIDSNITPDGVSADQIKAGRLAGVEISISVVSDAGLSRMNAGSVGGNQGLSEKDYARQVYHFSRVVDVPGM